MKQQVDRSGRQNGAENSTSPKELAYVTESAYDGNAAISVRSLWKVFGKYPHRLDWEVREGKMRLTGVESPPAIRKRPARTIKHRGPRQCLPDRAYPVLLNPWEFAFASP